MTTKIQNAGTGEFILSEASGTRSRDTGVITGGIYPAGTVLGKVTASGEYTQLAPSKSDGSEKASAVLYAAVDASSDVKAVVIVRDAEIDKGLLVFESAVTDAQKTGAVTALQSLGLIIR